MIPAALGPKTRVLAAIVIFANVFGNLFLSFGLRHGGAGPILTPHGYLAALANPWVSLGVTILILWMLARLALLSWADLSYVLPITSLGYVLTAMLGRLFLGEQIPPARWAGIALITAGAFLVSRTAIRTAGDRR